MNNNPTYCLADGLIHVVGFVETTLCSRALEGEHGDDEAIDVRPQTVTCPDCVRVISYVKQVPTKYLNQPTTKEK